MYQQTWIAGSSLCLLVLLSGCSVTLEVPLSRMELPETLGQSDMRLDFGAKGGVDVEVAEPVEQGSALESEPDTQRITIPSVGFAYGPHDRIDLKATVDQSGESTTLTAKTKFQILGEPAARASAGNTSLAVTLGAGYVSKTYEYDSDDEHYRGTIDSSLLDAAMIMGHRLNERVQIFGGVFGTRYDLEYRWSHRDQATLVAKSRQKSDIDIRGANFGFAFTMRRKWNAVLEFGAAQIDVQSTDEWVPFLGVMFGRTW